MELYSLKQLFRKGSTIGPVRFGGIFGRDVNQLGYYSSITIIFGLFLYHSKLIKRFIFFAICFISLFCIFLSGMRTGIYLIVSFLLFSFLFNKHKIIPYKFILFIGITILLLVFVIDIPNIQPIIDRFSISRLESAAFDLNRRHVGGMYVKCIKIMLLNNNSIISILFSCYPSWKFPDSLIIFLVANSGIIGLLFYFIFFVVNFCLIINSRIKDKTFLYFIIYFNFFIGIKGNFFFNNFSMILFTFIVFYIISQNYNYLEKNDEIFYVNSD